MSLFGGKKNEHHHLPAVVPVGQSKIHHGHNHSKEMIDDNMEGYLKMVPGFVVEILLKILRMALREKKGNCLVMYLKPEKEANGKKNIEDKVQIAVLDYDPRTMKQGIEEKLKSEYEKMDKLKKRVAFLEPKYAAYLKLLQNGKQ
jgi:hypothetical protein